MTPLAECMTLADMNEAALIRAAQITLRRAILERFPAGPERQKWLRCKQNAARRGDEEIDPCNYRPLNCEPWSPRR